MRDSFLLAGAALLAFGLSAAGVFHFDDYAIFNDPYLTSPFATRPLTNLTFWFNAATGGANPLGYHLLNLALHIATTLVLYRALTPSLPGRTALLAALIFAVHPIQTEPVNYVFARGTLLAALFCAASFDSWTRGRLWISVVWFTAALLAKEECVTFPVFLIAFTLAAPPPVAGPPDRRRQWWSIAAMLALALAAGVRVLIASAQVSGSGTGFNAHVSPAAYLSTQGLAILRYLRFLVIPWGFSIDPAGPSQSPWPRAAAWTFILAVAAVGARRFSTLKAGFWLVAGLSLLLPSSSIFPADDYAADRRMYLPMLAFSTAAAICLARIDLKLLGLLLCAWIAIDLHYAYIWNSEWRLWSEAAAQAPGKVRPLLQLARAAPNPVDGLGILGQAANLEPENAAVATEQGRLLLQSGRPAEALSAFGRALALTPDQAPAINNRGAALLALGQKEAARLDFERALARSPCLADARRNLRALGIEPPTAACREPLVATGR